MEEHIFYQLISFLHGYKKKFDIVFITETHLIKGTRFSLPNFTEFHNPLSDHNNRKPHGGVSCFIKNSVLRSVRKVVKNISEMIIVELVGEHKIFSNYIVPVDSQFSEVSEFSKVANMFSPKDSEKLIIGGGGGGGGGGGLNARVGNISQKLPANCSYRKNIDNVINDHGKILRDICSSFNCYVLNNMNIGDLILDGHFTFQKGDRKSQNDLVLTNKTGLSAVKNVQIHRIGWNPSDHTPVSVDVEFDVTNVKIAVDASFDILKDRCTSDLTKAQKIQSDKVDWNKYSVLVENDYANYENNLRLLHRSNQLDNVVNLLSDSLYKSATILSSKTIRDEGEIFHNQDPLIHEADKLLTEWHQGRRSMDEWESVRQEAITHLKQNVSLKEREAWTNVLRERDSKDLWQKINWKGTFDKSTTSKKPSLGELREQFMKKGQSVEDSTLLCEITDVNYIPELDSEFSMEEIVQATKRLKNNKSSGDGWVNKMITNLPMCILYAIQIIYNTILSSHIYPTKWRTTVVSEFFKNKSETDQATNYRGISLVPLLSKLFDFIL